MEGVSFTIARFPSQPANILILSHFPENFHHRLAYLGGAPGDPYPGPLHGLELLLGSALSAGDDGARVSHPLALGGGSPRYIADHGLGDVLPYEPGGLFLGRAAYLAYHDDGAGAGVLLEELQYGDEVGAVHGVSADADAGRLSEAEPGELVDRLVGEGPAAGYHADVAGLVYVAGHDAYLALSGGDDARAVGAHEPGVHALHEPPHPDHVEDRYALGDADDELYPGVDSLHYGVSGQGRRDVYARCVRAGLPDGLGYRIEYRYAVAVRAALARGHSADHPGAVRDHLPGVEGALLARNALADDLGVLVYEYA